MAVVTVTCHLAKIDLEACREHLNNQKINVRDICVEEEENDPDIIQWIFETTVSVLDLLR